MNIYVSSVFIMMGLDEIGKLFFWLNIKNVKYIGSKVSSTLAQKMS